MTEDFVNPHSSPFEDVELENRVVGTMLCFPNVVDKACGMLTPDAFTDPVNRLAFKTMQQMNTEGKAIDLLTVTHRLRNVKGKDPNVDYTLDLVQKTNSIVSSVQWEAYAEIVKFLFIKRLLFEQITKVSSEMRNEACNVYDTMHTLSRFIEDLESSSMNGADSVQNFDLVVADAAREMERRVECFASGKIVGIRTGSYELDRRVMGWQENKFIVIGGRTANGKTSFSLNAVRAAASSGVPVLFFSMEMPKVEIAQKLISAVGNISYEHIHSGNMSPEEMAAYYAAAKEIARLPIIVIDASLNIDDIYRIAKSMNRRHLCSMVVIDYLQKVPSAARNSREQEVAYIARRCKELANDVHIPVIALAQVNREVDKREDTMPMLSDLRESGAIEQDADMVIFVDKRVEHIGGVERVEQHISIAKHRAGALGRFVLYTNAAMTMYSDQPLTYIEYEDRTPF